MESKVQSHLHIYRPRVRVIEDVRKITMWNRVPRDTKADHVIEPARFTHALRVVELLVPLRLIVFPERPVAAELDLGVDRRVERLLHICVIFLLLLLLLFLVFFCRCSGRRIGCRSL